MPTHSDLSPDLRKAITRVRTIGPLSINGRSVLLRPPRFSDADSWVEVRSRGRAALEPSTASSPIPWEERHTRDTWVQECVALAKAQRAGQTVQFVIEIDGRFAGQCGLTWSEANKDAPEGSVWIDPAAGRSGAVTLGAAMLFDMAFIELGLARLAGECATDNEHACRRVQQLGFTLEATMASYFDSGSARKPYYMWSVTRSDVPEGGYLAKVLGETIELPVSRGSLRRVRPTRVAPSLVTPIARAYAGVYANAVRVSAIRRLALVPLITTRPIGTPLGTVAVGTPASIAGRLLATARKAIRRSSRPRWDLAVTLNGHRVGTCTLSSIYNLSTELAVQMEAGAPAEIATYATELAVQCALSAGFLRVWLTVPVGDTAGITAAKSAGMSQEGVLREFREVDGRRQDVELWAVVTDAQTA